MMITTTLGNSFFGAAKLVKSADIDKCKYSEYGIGFDRRGIFSIANGFGRNVIIFGVISWIIMQQIVIYLLMVQKLLNSKQKTLN